LDQSQLKHACDTRTDGQTDGRTELKLTSPRKSAVLVKVLDMRRPNIKYLN